MSYLLHTPPCLQIHVLVLKHMSYLLHTPPCLQIHVLVLVLYTLSDSTRSQYFKATTNWVTIVQHAATFIIGEHFWKATDSESPWLWKKRRDILLHGQSRDLFTCFGHAQRNALLISTVSAEISPFPSHVTLPLSRAHVGCPPLQRTTEKSLKTHSYSFHVHSVCLCFNATQYANTLSVAFSVFVFQCDTVCKYTECCIQYVCVSMGHSMQIHWVLHSVCLCFNVTQYANTLSVAFSVFVFQCDTVCNQALGTLYIYDCKNNAMYMYRQHNTQHNICV